MEISNEMIYELLKGFKEDVNRRFEGVSDRFDQSKEYTDNRFDQIDKRLDLMDKRFEQIERQQIEDRKILIDLWEHRDKMKLNLTRSLLTITGIVSGVIAIIVSFITGRAVILSR